MLTLIGEDPEGEPMDINPTPFNISNLSQLKTLENALKVQKQGIGGGEGEID